MNLYYPECLGMEVAAIVRQEDSNQSIPIIYITGETQMQKILLALNKGGDDFLPLPVTADRLISSVAARVDRARILKSLLVRDSLTSLLNHTALRQVSKQPCSARAREKGKRFHLQWWTLISSSA